MSFLLGNRLVRPPFGQHTSHQEFGPWLCSAHPETNQCTPAAQCQTHTTKSDKLLEFKSPTPGSSSTKTSTRNPPELSQWTAKNDQNIGIWNKPCQKNGSDPCEKYHAIEKKRMLGLHGIIAPAYPQTSMQLKETGGFWFMDRYNGQCFVDVKTAPQKKRKKRCRSSSKSDHFFFQWAKLFSCSWSVRVLQYYMDMLLEHYIYMCYSVHSSVTVLNVLYIYTHTLYIYMELRRPTVSTAHLSCTVDVQELQVPGIKAEDVHLSHGILERTRWANAGQAGHV